MILEFLFLFLSGVFAGFFGALVGIGGGVILIPVLTLIFKLPIHQAIAISIVSVIATSIAGARSYIKQEITNVRLGLVLEIATTLGALAGALISVLLKEWVLSMVFGVLIFYMAALAFTQRSKDEELINSDIYNNQSSDKFSQSLKLKSSYYDKAANKTVYYNTTAAVKGSLIVSLAGLGSGLLGIGGGVINVIAMNSFMRVPMKAAVGTSKLMIGITAATSAVIYFLAYRINQFIVAPVALGTIIGATLGSLIMNKLPTKLIKTIFILLMIYLGYEMIAHGVLQAFNFRLPGLI